MSLSFQHSEHPDSFLLIDSRSMRNKANDVV